MQSQSQKYRSTVNSRGFTLLEVLIAMAIFSIGILAVASMQFFNVKNNATGNIITQATMLARSQMETLKSQDIGGLVVDEYDDPNNPVDENGDPGGIFFRSWEITDPLADNNYRQIQVTVSWQRLGQNRRVMLTTITTGNGT